MAFDPSQPSDVVSAPSGFDPSLPSTIVDAPDLNAAGQRVLAGYSQDPTKALPTAQGLVAQTGPYLQSSALGRDASAIGSAIFGGKGGYIGNAWTNAQDAVGGILNNAYEGVGNIKDELVDKALQDAQAKGANYALSNLASNIPLAVETGVGTGIYGAAKPFISGGIKLATDAGGDARRLFGDTQGAAEDEAQVDLDKLQYARNVEGPALNAVNNASGLPALSTAVSNVVPFALPAGLSLETGGLASRIGSGVTDALTPAAEIAPVTPAVSTGTNLGNAISMGSHLIGGPHGHLLRTAVRAGANFLSDAGAADEVGGLQGVSSGPRLPFPYIPAAQQAAESANLASNLSASSAAVPGAGAIAAGQLAGAGANALGAVGTGALYGLANSNPGEEEDAVRQGAGFGALFSPLSVISGGFQRQNLAETAKNADLVKAGTARSTGTDLVAPDKADIINGLQGASAGAKTEGGNPIRYVVQSPEDYAVAADAVNGGQVADAANSRGFFNEDTGKVHLNAADPDILGTLHETGHAVASALSGIDTAQSEALNQTIAASSLKNGQPTPNFQRFIDQYNGSPVDWSKLSPEDQSYYLNEIGAQTAAQLSNLNNPAKYALPSEASDVVFNALGNYARKLGLKPSPDVLSGIGDGTGAPITPDPTVLQASDQALRTIAAQPRSGIDIVPDATPVRPTAGYQMPALDPVKSGLGIGPRPFDTTPQFPRPLAPVIASKSVEPTSVAPDPTTLQAYQDALALATAPKKIGGLALSQKDAKAKIDAASEAGATSAEALLFHAQTGRLPDARTTPTPIRATPVAETTQEAAVPQPADEAPAQGQEVNRLTDTRPEPATEPRDVEEVSNPPADSPAQPIPAGSQGQSSQTEVSASNPAQEEAQTAAGQIPFAQADIDRITAQVQKDFVPKAYKPKTGTAEEKTQKVADNLAMQKSVALRNALGEAHAASLPDGDSRVQMRVDPETGNRSIRGTHFVDDDPFHQMLLSGTNDAARAGIDNAEKAIGDNDLLNFDYNSAERVRTQQTAAQRQESQAKNTVAMRRTGLGTEEANKSHKPYSISIGQDGTPSIAGYSPDKLLGNAETVMEALRANNMSDRLPYENVNDPLFVQDVQTYIRNHANGYKGDGSARLTPTEDVAVPPVSPGYKPGTLPPARANLMNIIMGAEPTLSEKQIVASTGLKTGSAKARDFAAMNANPPSESGEVNPLRGELNAANLPKVGEDVGSSATLHPDVLSETIKPEFMSNFRDPATSPEFTNLRAAPFRGDRRALLPEGQTPNRQFASSGFLPARSAGASTPEEAAQASKAWQEKGTDSPYFQKWFGGSKVTDDQGNPKLLYHGTGSHFDEFSHDSKRATDEGNLGRGFYFSDQERIARSYSTMAGARDPITKAAYIDIKNPLNIPDKKIDSINAAATKLGVQSAPDWNGNKQTNPAWSREFTERAKAAGHDGVIVGNGWEVVPFEPSQIKTHEENQPNSPTQFSSAEEWGKSLADANANPVRNNVVDKPYKGDFQPGKLSIDKYGENPYVYQAQYINPKSFKDILNLEGKTYDQVVNMPSTQKYIQWYKEGHEPPPVDVVLKGDDKIPNSVNRRRVVAALEAGVQQIPANVEIGQRDDIFQQAQQQGH